MESYPRTLRNLGFGCSPLSCNGMAERVPVNSYCLVDGVNDAVAGAKQFAREQPEPGPYVVIEVLHRATAR